MLRKNHAAGAAITTAITAVLLLTGCTGSLTLDDSTTPAQVPEPVPEDPFHLEEVQLTLSDGRVVTCIEYNQLKAGGVSCDWDSANGLLPGLDE